MLRSYAYVRKRTCGLASVTVLIRRSGIPGILLLFWPIFECLITRRRDPDMYAVLDTSAILQIAYVVVCLTYVLHYYMLRRIKLVNLLKSRPIVWLFCYIILGGLSAIWSINPAYSLYTAFESAVFLLLIAIVYLKLDKDCDVVVEWILYWVVFSNTFIAILKLAHYIPIKGAIGALHGIDCSMGSILFLALLMGKRKFLSAYILIVCLLGMSSKVYLGIPLGLTTCALITNKRGWHIFLLFSILSLMLAIAVAGPAKTGRLAFIGKSDEVIIGCTGRIFLWQTLLSKVLEKPILGHGYVVGERWATEEGVKIWHAHNTLLAAILGTGIPGLFLILVLYGDALWLCLHNIERFDLRAGLAASLVMTFFMSFFSSGVATRVFDIWIPSVMLLMLVSISNRRKEGDYMSKTEQIIKVSQSI